MEDKIKQTILAHFPDSQAIYLFGSFGTENEWKNSDVDIALLLPLTTAKQTSFLDLWELQLVLERVLRKEVDLINLRQVTTVFQKEIIMTDRRIFCADVYTADEFEMLTMSYYQKLNEERAGILAEFAQTGRAYPV